MIQACYLHDANWEGLSFHHFLATLASHHFKLCHSGGEA